MLPQTPQSSLERRLPLDAPARRIAEEIASAYPSAARAIEQSLCHPDGPERLAAGAPQPLGEILRSSHRIAEPVVEAAMEEHRKSGDRLGEVLVRRGEISAQERDALLRFQKFQRGELPADGVLRVGSILEAQGVVTSEQLARALANQRASGRRIGDELVAAGYCAPAQVERALELQGRLVSLVASLAMTLAVAAGGMAPRTASASGTQGRVQVGATVMARVRVEAMEQVPTVSVTRADIDRGYVEVPSGSRFELSTNCASQITVRRTAAWFRSVRVSGLPAPLDLNEGGAAVQQLPAYVKKLQASLSFRFELPPGAEAGTYTWPLALSLMPV